MKAMKLRPHHILDIVTDHGAGKRFMPHPYGHSLHQVGPAVLAQPDRNVRLVLASDDICKGCIHLRRNGLCDDVLAQLNPSPSKQAYNDLLDARLFDRLKLKPGSIMSVRKYLEIVRKNLRGLEKICTHPKENMKKRRVLLKKGLAKLKNFTPHLTVF